MIYNIISDDNVKLIAESNSYFIFRVNKWVSHVLIHLLSYCLKVGKPCAYPLLKLGGIRQAPQLPCAICFYFCHMHRYHEWRC